MSLIDKIVLWILVVSARYFFDNLEVKTDKDEDNVIAIKMWK
jgi:hypothetical protein